MTIEELFLRQLVDPFRWGLLVALVFTTTQNRPVTGTFVPLLAGVLFVAVLLPLTTTPAAAPMVRQTLVGVAANLVALGVILLAKRLIAQFRPPRG